MSVRQVKIGGCKVGLIDLDTIFEQVRDMRITDTARLKSILVDKVRSRNYVPPNLEDVYKEDILEEYRVFTGELAARSPAKGVIEIRVYGPGCPRCGKLDRMTKEILASKGIPVDYQYIKDIGETAAEGIAVTPALTINGRIVISGRVPGKKALEKLIMEMVEEGNV